MRISQVNVNLTAPLLLWVPEHFFWGFANYYTVCSFQNFSSRISRNVETFTKIAKYVETFIEGGKGSLLKIVISRAHLRGSFYSFPLQIESLKSADSLKNYSISLSYLEIWRSNRIKNAVLEDNFFRQTLISPLLPNQLERQNKGIKKNEVLSLDTSCYLRALFVWAGVKGSGAISICVFCVFFKVSRFWVRGGKFWYEQHVVCTKSTL